MKGWHNMNIKEVLQDIYLDYVNNHLTLGEQIAKGCYKTEDN